MKKNILIFGLINSLAFLVINLNAIYNSDINPVLIMFSLFIGIIITAILSAFFYKKKQPNSSSFRDLFLTILGGQTIGHIVGTVLLIIFYTLLSEESKMALINENLDNQFKYLSDMAGTNTIAFQDSLEKAAESLFSIDVQIFSALAYMVVSTFIAAIVALCMKQE